MQRSILLLGNHPPPFGGVPAHIAELAPYLVKNGWKVDVLSPKFKLLNNEKKGAYGLFSLIRLSKLNVIILLLRNIGKVIKHSQLALDDWQIFFQSLLLYDQAVQIYKRNKFSVVSSYHIFPSGLVGAWLRDDYGVILVTTIFGEFYSQVERHRKAIIEVGYVFASSKAVLSCSEHCADSKKLMEFCQQVKERNVECVYYGVDVSRFSPTVNTQVVRELCKIRSVDLTVLFVGRMVEEMGLDILLSSIPKVLNEDRNIRFIIVGATGSLTVEALLMSEKYPESIFVHENVAFELLPSYYAVATVTVVPSVNERACLGLAAIESMSAGTPVIIANVGGGPELLRNGGGGVLVEPGNVDSLASAIIDLCADENRRTILGEQGRENAVKNFSNEATLRRMEEVFDSE